MIFRLSMIPVWVATILLSACHTKESVTTSDPSKKADASVFIPAKSTQVMNTTDAAFDFLRANIQSGNTDKNVCLSPISLDMAMAMVAVGASGETLDQIVAALGWESGSQLEIAHRQQQLVKRLVSDEDITIETANSIWVNDDMPKLNADFVRINKDSMEARVERLPFDDQMLDRVNQWCGEHTHGRIPTLLNEVPKGMAMMLVNALYFNGKWANPFMKEATEQKPFYNADGRVSKVDMMFQKNSHDYIETEQYQAIALPFVSSFDKQYAMFFVLPKEGCSTSEVLATMNGKAWRTMCDGMQQADVRLTLPKFKLEYSTIINETLQKMGITRAFDTNRAQFPGINSTPLCIDQVLQKTFLEVSESGAEAAAVTAIMMKVMSAMPRPAEVKTMTVDRPFIFAIGSMKTDDMLFLGTIEKL